MSFKIITDTSCNLPKKLLEKGDVEVIPFSYYPKSDATDLRQCTDNDSFDGKAYYDSIRNGEMYNTSQITPGDYIDVFSAYAEKGEDILFVSMSSGISGSYNSSLTAVSLIKDKYPSVGFYMFDTRAASLGEGISVLKAVECREKGMSAEECVKVLEELRDKVYQIFTVDSLRHLQRTGRLSGVAMILGTVLSIKPILKGNEKGEIVNIDKAHGRKKAIKALADKYNELVRDASEQTVYIAHADNVEDTEALIALLNEKNPPKSVFTACYEPVTGAHVGPGTVALFFIGDSDVRSK